MALLSPEIHPLLTSDLIAKLDSRNVHTIQQFLDADLQQLSTITNLTYKNILTIRTHILNKNAALTRTGDEYFEELLKSTAVIATGIKSLDNILGGGFRTGNIYEVCGLPCSGKTQFCYTVLARYADTNKNNILYIDTKRDFCADRLTQITGTTDTLKYILVQHTNTPHELVNSLHEIDLKLKLRLIIIDSLPAVIYQNVGHEKLNMNINCLVNVMRFIAVEYHVAFLVTNTMTTWREGTDFECTTSVVEKVGSGKRWRCVPNTRLKFARVDEGTCRVTVLKSSQVKEGLGCTVKLCERGICD